MANHLKNLLLLIFFLTNLSSAALLPSSSLPTTITSSSLPLQTLPSKLPPPNLGLHYPEILPQEREGQEQQEQETDSTIKPRQEAAPAAPPAPTNAPPAPVAGDGSIPPLVTGRPEVNLEKEGYRQETYYTCKTRDGRESCGWHEPLVEVGGGERVKGRGGVVSVVVGGVVGVFVMGLL